MGAYGTGTSISYTLRKLAIFIDGSNFLSGYGEFKNNQVVKELNYPALQEDFISRQWKKRNTVLFEHIKTYCYMSAGTPDIIKSKSDILVSGSDITKFKTSLKQNHVKLTEKQKINNKEKGVDMALAVDLLSLAYSNAYDYAIIVSGDADFISAIEEVKRYGKIIYIASFLSRFSKELMMHVDDVMILDSYYKENI
jgi:uncharacterized LabA/DUF88 family protein